MLLMLSVRFAAAIHYYLQAFAPTNILLRHLRTRDGLKWAIPAALVLVPIYLFAAAITTAVIADGGPGWLNLVVLTCIWNAMKLAWITLLSPIYLLRRPIGVRRVGWSAGGADDSEVVGRGPRSSLTRASHTLGPTHDVREVVLQ